MTGCVLSKKDNSRIPYVFGGGVRELFEREVDLLPGVISAEDLESRRKELAPVELILCTWNTESLGAEQIRAYFPSLRCLFYIAGSVQYFARPFLERGVRVFSAWGSMAVPVAEFALAQIVLASKGAYLASALYRREAAGGGDSGRDPDSQAAYDKAKSLSIDRFPGTYATRIGILGCGQIGSLVLEGLKSFNVETLVFDPFAPDEKIARLGARRASLAEVFSRCSVVSNHLANNEQTAGMLGYSLFSSMGECAAFINTGRGAQVVEADLARALRDEPSRCALLDVTWPEPCPKGHEFWSLPNVFITPHIAGMGLGDTRRMSDYILEEIRRYKAGEALRSEVTLPMLATMA